MWNALHSMALAVTLALSIQAAQGEENSSPGPVAEPANARPFDKKGLVRDTKYFLGYQFFAVGVISLWPQDETNYSDSPGFDTWLDNVTHPHWDEDKAFVNYVLHPYWGAGYYVRGRERGLDRTQAFWYSALLSSIFEFGAEAMVEKVSYQDLIATPVLGSLLGEYVFWPMRERILGSGRPLDTVDKVTLALTDPLGAINSGVDHLFGVKTDVRLGVMAHDDTWSRRFKASAGPYQMPRACGACKPGWGMQVRVDW